MSQVIASFSSLIGRLLLSNPPTAKPNIKHKVQTFISSDFSTVLLGESIFFQFKYLTH